MCSAVWACEGRERWGSVFSDDSTDVKKYGNTDDSQRSRPEKTIS